MKINRREKVLLYVIDGLQGMINKGFLPQEIFTEKGKVLRYSISAKGKKMLKKLKPEPTPDEIIGTIIGMGDEGLIDKYMAKKYTKDFGDEFFIKN